MADRATKEPFDPDAHLFAAIKRHAMDRGLMCYPMSGAIDGRLGNHILLAPPFIIDENHIGEIVEKLGPAIDEAITDISA